MNLARNVKEAHEYFCMIYENDFEFASIEREIFNYSRDRGYFSDPFYIQNINTS